MPKTHKRPCSKCTTPYCNTPCDRYRNYFRRKWKQINDYIWRYQNEKGKPRPFHYPHPHEATLQNDPCRSCPCRSWCDTPCTLRLQWWDIKMAQLRKALRDDGGS